VRACHATKFAIGAAGGSAETRGFHRGALLPLFVGPTADHGPSHAGCSAADHPTHCGSRHNRSAIVHILAETNARVPATPILSSLTVNILVAIASATHRRPAASRRLRQSGRQNIWRLPPLRRGVNPLPHQRQARSPACVATANAKTDRLNRFPTSTLKISSTRRYPVIPVTLFRIY
jgi:hypothetical protein